MGECQCHCSCGTNAAAPAETGNSTASAAITADCFSHYRISQMDCPAEERLVRMALQPLGTVQQLQFDLAARELKLWHQADPRIIDALRGLGLGAQVLVDSQPASSASPAPTAVEDPQQAARERRTLYLLLVLNALMFLVEAVAGWWAQSSGLLADGLDMLADALVYGLALWAVGSDVLRQRRAAHLSGWLQGALAGLILLDAVRRFLFGSEPMSAVMAGVGLLALAVNVACLWLLLRQRGEGAHLRASLIFSANDVLANLGLLLAAGLVSLTGSRYPDLLIGLAIAALVLHGARRILRLQ